ncbi:ABC transporter permease protein [Sphingobium sp. SYK-6]|uniref:microcin C ABC transporter permease YejB n=1 Tax=Sphingobium sp. (strain NBRC 103272 / SYK-6) TaxID=627192 RepID=UPI0002276730|nr:microcin C ABC transporter permease YejB [Sphingobium sp. SYK-6]BAK65131.1 ABC transporter permease protein [Sphingobium sp. SYK-6]
MTALWSYIARRLLLMVPTLIGIVTVSFIIIQFVPGGPIDQIHARFAGQAMDATATISGSTDVSGGGGLTPTGELDPEMVKELEKLYGFDKPVLYRYFKMLGDFARFEFGNSYFKDQPVVDLIIEKLPVSVSLGLWTTLITYLVAVPLGIRKAVRAGTSFDAWTSFFVTVGYAIPGFLFAVLLVVLFAGGNFWSIFPARGLVSENWEELSTLGKIGDYLWHITLPVTAMVIGAFANLTMLTKNSILDEVSKQYVTTARAKGLSENGVLYGHVFRNAMLIVIAGFPAAFVGVLFTSSLLIEVIFSLDGLGLLGFEATINRDYPVMLGSLFIFSLLGLLANLIGDITYVLVDPRIDFERRDV